MRVRRRIHKDSAKSEAMGASLCRCRDGPYVTPGSPLHNVQQNRLDRCTPKVVKGTALSA